jgi:hypothetical protein
VGNTSNHVSCISMTKLPMELLTSERMTSKGTKKDKKKIPMTVLAHSPCSPLPPPRSLFADKHSAMLLGNLAETSYAPKYEFDTKQTSQCALLKHTKRTRNPRSIPSSPPTSFLIVPCIVRCSRIFDVVGAQSGCLLAIHLEVLLPVSDRVFFFFFFFFFLMFKSGLTQLIRWRLRTGIPHGAGVVGHLVSLIELLFLL